MSTVDQCRIRRQQLNRSYLNVIAFADCGARAAIRLSRRMVVSAYAYPLIAALAWPQDPLCFIVRSAGRLPKTELSQRLKQLSALQPQPDSRTLVVARVSNCLGGREGRQVVGVDAGNRKIATVKPPRTNAVRVFID